MQGQPSGWDTIRDWWAAIALLLGAVTTLLVAGVRYRLGHWFPSRKEWIEASDALQVRIKALENSKVDMDDRMRKLEANVDRVASNVEAIREFGTKPTVEMKHEIDRLARLMEAHTVHLAWMRQHLEGPGGRRSDTEFAILSTRLEDAERELDGLRERERERFERR